MQVYVLVANSTAEAPRLTAQAQTTVYASLLVPLGGFMHAPAFTSTIVDGHSMLD